MTVVEETLNFLENIDLSENNAYEKILLRLESSMITLPTLEYQIQKGTILFRSRENFSVNHFTKFDEIACPPKECVTQFNRANRPFQSMFYCSDSVETSYSEFGEDWKDKPVGSVYNVTFGVWRVLKDINVILFYDLNKLGGKINLVKGDSWDLDSDKIKTNKFLLDKFSMSSYNNKPIYTLTSAISNNLLLRSNLAGVMFPSIPRNGTGINFAFKPEVYLSGYLKLEQVFRDTFLTIRKPEENKADHMTIFRVNSKLDIENQTIEWKTSS